MSRRPVAPSFPNLTPAQGAEIATREDTGAEAFLSLMPTEVLAAVAQGVLDLNTLAVRQLANRGLDSTGAWVGFDAARIEADLTISDLGYREPGVLA